MLTWFNEDDKRTTWLRLASGTPGELNPTSASEEKAGSAVVART